MINLRDKKILKAFGKHVKELRESEGLTQKQLANNMDIEISQISRIENGKINPSLCTIVKLANTLEIKLSKLVDIEF